MRVFHAAHKRKELIQAEELVALGMRHIHEQEALIARLRKGGRPTAHAERLLETFHDCQKLHEEHRNMIVSDLAAQEAKPRS